MDGIDWNTIEHTNIYGNSLKRGIWEWGFLYKEGDVPASEIHPRRTEPYRSLAHYSISLLSFLSIIVFVIRFDF